MQLFFDMIFERGSGGSSGSARISYGVYPSRSAFNDPSIRSNLCDPDDFPKKLHIALISNFILSCACDHDLGGRAADEFGTVEIAELLFDAETVQCEEGVEFLREELTHCE